MHPALQCTHAIRRSGFSLVEVTLALAVMAIGLVAIIGMIPQGVQSSRDAADNTIAATILHDAFNAIRAGPFTTADPSKYGFCAFTPAGPYDLRTFNTPISVFLDSSGSCSPATPQDRYYKVALNFQPQPNLPSTVVTATLTWPDKGTAILPHNTNVFVTQIANYQQ